jgi:hypothetical protein
MHDDDSQAAPAQHVAARPRRIYEVPRLTVVGTVRGLTFASGSIGSDAIVGSISPSI